MASVCAWVFWSYLFQSTFLLISFAKNVCGKHIQFWIIHFMDLINHLMLQYTAALPIRLNLVVCHGCIFSLITGTNLFPKTQFLLIFNTRPWTTSVNQQNSIISYRFMASVYAAKYRNPSLKKGFWCGF